MKHRFANLFLSVGLAAGLGTALFSAQAASGPPVITNQPASRIALLGSATTFRVGADGRDCLKTLNTLPPGRV